MADDAIGQHDVARPAARPAEADEHPVAARPVLRGQPLPALGQRQRRGAPRAVPGRVAPVPLGVNGKPAPPDIAPDRNAVGGRRRRHSAAAFRFSYALMRSFFSASSSALNRYVARTIQSIESPRHRLERAVVRSIGPRIRIRSMLAPPPLML